MNFHEERKQDNVIGWYIYVSRPLAIKQKTLFLKIELKTFSNRGDFYGHLDKKVIQISQNWRNGKEIKSIYKKTTV